VRSVSLTNTAFEGENTVYVLGEDGEGPLTLVDVGADERSVRDALATAFESFGRSLADVERVLLTHYHGDHAGLAGWLQRESDATVYVHEADAGLAARRPDAVAAARRLHRERFEAWGMPAGKREEVLSVLAIEDEVASGTLDVTTVADGEALRAGPRTLTVRHLPGHTAGHVGYVSADGRDFWSGDVVLPKYTPNVGGADLRVERALATYLDSLSRVVEMAPETAWPGHRDPIADPIARAREIVAHHVERTENVLDVLRERGPSDAWSVSAALFGDLHGIHVLHGPGEAAAHLEHLADAGVVREDDGVYGLRERDPDVRALFPDA